MNQRTHFTLSFYHLALAVRDTIEYIQKRPSYPLPIYLAKKNTIALALKENSPFVNFCAKNGEIGTKIKEQLEDLYDICYGDDQTFVSIEGNEVKPDAAQFIKVLDYVIPLRQSLINILRAYIGAQKNDGSYEEGTEELVGLEDKFYRSVFLLVIQDYLFNNLFQEFNKAMRETQGKESIQSNFISNDIKKVISMINFIKKHAPVNDISVDMSFGEVQRGIKLISGIEKVSEGSTFQQEFQKIGQACYQTVAQLEPEWRAKHTVIWNQLVEFEKEMQAKAQNNAN
jgi:hypothetical protein